MNRQSLEERVSRFTTILKSVAHGFGWLILGFVLGWSLTAWINPWLAVLSGTIGMMVGMLWWTVGE